MVKRLILNNGFGVAVKEMPGFYSASAGIWVNSGARFEGSEQKGVAHFLEHIVFKGSKKYSARKIKSEIEGRGGSINAFTSQETTGFYVKLLNKDIFRALDILFDMAVRPLVRERDVSKERGVILEEIKMYNDMPSSRCLSILDKLCWHNSPLGEDIIGTDFTVKNISSKDILNFKDRFYTAPNMLAVIAAPGDSKKIIKYVQKKVSQLNGRKRPEPAPAKFNRGVEAKVEKTSLSQAHLALGFPGPSYKSSLSERITTGLLHTIMGANMSSRLFESLREMHGLVYEVSTDVKSYSDSGAFVVHCALDSRNIFKALRIILREISRIKSVCLGKKEFKRAKEYLLGSFLMRLENPLNMMFYIADSLANIGRVYSPEDIEKTLEKINPAGLRKFAGKVFNMASLKVSLVSPQDITEISLKKTVEKWQN